MNELVSKFVTFYYYGSRDYLGGYFVKQVYKNINYLEQNIELINKPISTLDDIYTFLWSYSYKKMVDDIDNYKIDQEIKKRVIDLSNNINLQSKAFIKFINNNYAIAFVEKNHNDVKWGEFIRSCLELCYGPYLRSIKKEVFNFLEENNSIYILNLFHLCSSFYLNNRDRFQVLFKDLRQTTLFDDQIYLSFLKNYSDKRDEFLKEQAKFICERTLDAVLDMHLTEDSMDLLQTQSMFVEYEKLAILYKLPCANKYASVKKDIQTKVTEFIKKHGIMKKFGPINIKELTNRFENNDDPYKYLCLTHHTGSDGVLINSLDNILSSTNEKDPLSELFNDISRKRSKKYPFYKQDSMHFDLSIRIKIIAYLLQEEKFTTEFANYIYNISLTVQKEYFKNQINIEKEITGEIDVILSMIDLDREKQFNSPLGKTMMYGNSLAICTTIEKILRNVALKEVETTEYLDFSKTTLSDLLGETFKLKDVSAGLKYHLEFYLIREITNKIKVFERPGLNIRNNLMHGEDDAYETTDYGTCITLLYFVISLLDDLLLTLKFKD